MGGFSWEGSIKDYVGEVWGKAAEDGLFTCGGDFWEIV